MSHPMPCRLNSPRSATTAPSLTTGWSTQMTDGSSMTKACPVAAVLCELLESHMQACDVRGRQEGDHHHHNVSAVQDQKSTRLNSRTNEHLVCCLLHEQQNVQYQA